MHNFFGRRGKRKKREKYTAGGKYPACPTKEIQRFTSCG